MAWGLEERRGKPELYWTPAPMAFLKFGDIDLEGAWDESRNNDHGPDEPVACAVDREGDHLHEWGAVRFLEA
jgi:hypothetical protein